MKLVSFLIVLLFGSSAFAMQIGTYECEGYDDLDEVDYSYGLILEPDRLEIHFNMSTPNDVFLLGRRNEPFRVKLLSQEEIADRVELIEYNFFQRSHDSLELTTFTHYSDGVIKFDATITQINSSEIEVYVVTSSGGGEVEYIDYCTYQGQF